MSVPVSFSFSKKAQPKKLLDSKLRDESTREKKEERDFVRCVVGNRIEGTLIEETPKEWVIPLIKHNKWRSNTDETIIASSAAKELSNKAKESARQEPKTLTADESLERQAIREILNEANAPEEDGQTTYEIPLLLQNRIPSGYESDNNMDVSLRPEQSTLKDYDNFPVEHFGLAMLRGMGWTEKEGIGRTNKGVVELKEPTLRPKGLGLGAERPSANKDAVPSKNRNEDEAKLILKIGAFALINKGSNKGMYGQVESFDEDNNRVILKLVLTSKMAAVSKFYIDVVSPAEFKAKSKILNMEKFEKYKQIHDERDLMRNADKHRDEGDDSINRDSSRSRNKGVEAVNGDTKRHREDYDLKGYDGRERDRVRKRSPSRDYITRGENGNSSKHKHSKKERKMKQKKRRQRKRSPSSSSSSSSSDDRKSRRKKKR